MAFPVGSLIPWVEQRFCDEDGRPLAGGRVVFKITGTNTDKDTFDDSGLDPGDANTNPVVLGADGRPESGAIFFEPGGYDVFVYDGTTPLPGVLQYTVSGVEDVGQTFLSTLGQTFSQGVRDAPDGYTFIATDFTATILPVGSGQYSLPTVVGRGQNLAIINKGAIAATLNTFGLVQGINGVATPMTLPTGSSPVFAGVVLAPSTADTSWFIQSYWTS